jgi:hypothetical protein
MPLKLILCPFNLSLLVLSFLISVYSLFPKKVELQALMKFYDVDGSGSIGFEEFLGGLR